MEYSVTIGTAIGGRPDLRFLDSRPLRRAGRDRADCQGAKKAVFVIGFKQPNLDRD
jgi:hypothetical protein